MKGQAAFSECGQYRYVLSRNWEIDGRKLVAIMLNPSTADAEVDDPTVRRLIKFAKSWNMDGLAIVNLFAYRTANPRELLSVKDPTGPENDDWLRCMVCQQPG